VFEQKLGLEDALWKLGCLKRQARDAFRRDDDPDDTPRILETEPAMELETAQTFSYSQYLGRAKAPVVGDTTGPWLEFHGIALLVSSWVEPSDADDEKNDQELVYVAPAVHGFHVV
jgi:hypothetical protein